MTAPAPLSARERLSFDQGWRFHLGDIPFPVIRGHSDSYTNAKAGVAWGAAAPAYDDSSWPEVTLPHDWAVAQPCEPKNNLSQGYRARGFGWYRRHFRLPADDRGRHLEIQFDGIATHCTVWLNGTVVHRNWCGYTSFAIDMTALAKYGDDLNTLAIRVDAHAMEGWWYEGAGIYRHAWLVKRHATHLVTDGVFAHPVPSPAGDDRWTLPVQATVGNSGQEIATVGVHVTLLDPAGTPVAHAETHVAVGPLDEIVAHLHIPITAPRLWSVDDPALYTVRTALTRDGREVDALTTPAGFRTIRFDADHGFFLNGQPLKLQGVCCHADHAGVGVALPDSIWEFRVRRLKEMGVNAYRCAHNPPSAEFLDLCDRHGILVMDENRHFNSSPEYVRQLQWLIRRDRNHPSVILWSVFNEEPMQGSEIGYEMVRRLVAVVRKLDRTRPVTAAMNGGLFSPINVSQAVDVVGFNYQIESYDRFHAANPHLPLTSSEDASAFATRGAGFTDRARHLLADNDRECAPWGATHRHAWRAVAQRPYLAGAFVWTGFDYRGEPTPLQWPTASSFFGIMDLCGFAKTAFHLHRAQWVKTQPVLHLAPHWNWPGHEGQTLEVLAATNADTVALSLNGEPLGEKPIDPYDMATWQVPYRPGRLEAIAYRTGAGAGVEIARTAVETTGAPVALRLTPDRPTLAGDGSDAQPVTVDALDAHGRPVPDAAPLVTLTLTGPGTILGHGNGDPNCHDPETGPHRRLFHGLAQVIIQSTATRPGPLTLRATAPGLAPAEVTLEVLPAPQRPFVPLADPILALDLWRLSPLSEEPLDPNIEVADNDMNSWVTTQPGELQSFALAPSAPGNIQVPIGLISPISPTGPISPSLSPSDTRHPGGIWGIYRVRFTPFLDVQRRGGQLVFRSLTGRAEVWMDHTLLGTKIDPAPAPLRVSFPPAAGSRTLSVLVRTDPGQPAGFDGLVTIEKLENLPDSPT